MGEISAIAIKERLLAAPGVVDPITQHHEFVGGTHGRKCDIDEVPEDSELFRDMVELTASAIQDAYDPLPDMLIGVANGANRFIPHVTGLLGIEVSGRKTWKNPLDKRDIRLTERTQKAISRTHPKLTLVLDDLGTEGTNAARVVRQARKAGAQNTEALYIVHRNDRLVRLDELDVVYWGIIRVKDELPTYTKAECKARYYCKQGVELKPYGQ
jgi:orotate phosphoribosyltransferase